MIDGSAENSTSLDRYVVLEYLSEGGMGAIFLGKKLGAGGFEKPVVLKQLLPEFTSQREFTDLFLREARLSATLDHANIVHTIDLVTAGNEYFIVMEYVAGADLRTLLQKAKRRRKRMSPAAAIYVTREVLSALAYAHAKVGPDGKPLRLIHRDVSPSNLMISRNGEVKLTDFGIAKAATHNSVFYRVKGKIGYMSPEQARSETMDYRSDLYSLAVCMYEIITGEKLFVHVGLTTSVEEIYSQPVPSVSEKVAGLPAAFDEVMFKALAIDPDDRYQSAGELQEALLRFAHQAGLMMSAPELAAHLRDVGGDPAYWRDLDHDGNTVGSTEVYDEGTEKIDIREMEDDALENISIDPDNSFVSERLRRDRQPVVATTSDPNLNRLKGLELTSMIRLGKSREVPGSRPLVDLDEGGSLGQSSPSIAEVGKDMAMDPALATIEEMQPPIRLSDMDSVALPVSTGLVRRSAEMEAAAEARRGMFPIAPLVQGQRRWNWVVWVFIVILGISVAVAVGLSGPGLDQDETLGAPGTADPPPAGVQPNSAERSQTGGGQEAAMPQ